MAAATVRLGATSRVPAMCAAILIIGRRRTFTRCVSACFGRLCVVHFRSPLCLRVFSLDSLIGISKKSNFLRALPISNAA